MIFVQKASTLDSAMKGALKNHIMRKRQRLKQEMEQDAIEKRLKKEREQQRKQDAMTLDQIKEQLAVLEKKLDSLKDEKHNLFAQLKKVLNEEVARQKQREADMLAASQAQQASVTQANQVVQQIKIEEIHHQQQQQQQQQPQQQQQHPQQQQQQQMNPVTLMNNHATKQSMKLSKDAAINQPRMPMHMPSLYPYHMENHVPPPPHIGVHPPRSIPMYPPRVGISPISIPPVSTVNMRMNAPIRPMSPMESAPSRSSESSSYSNSLKRSYPPGLNDPRDQLISSPRKTFLSQNGGFHLAPPQPPQPPHLRSNPSALMSTHNRRIEQVNALKHINHVDATPRRIHYGSPKSSGSHEASPSYQSFGNAPFAYPPTSGLASGPPIGAFHSSSFSPKDLKDNRPIQPLTVAFAHASSRLAMTSAASGDFDRIAHSTLKQYYDGPRGSGLHSPHSSMMLGQPSQLRPGGITSGYPLLRRGGSSSGSSPGSKAYNSPR